MGKPKATPKRRMELVLPEDEFLVYETLAREVGITVSDVIRMKLKGFEPTRKAA